MTINSNRFKCKLAEQQISVVKFAEKCGLSFRTVKRCMNGETVTAKTVGKVAKALGVSVDELIVD